MEEAGSIASSVREALPSAHPRNLPVCVHVTVRRWVHRPPPALPGVPAPSDLRTTPLIRVGPQPADPVIVADVQPAQHRFVLGRATIEAARGREAFIHTG